MYPHSPHRVGPRLKALIAAAAVTAGLAALPAGPHPLAVQSDTRLQGSVPKAPAMAPGFPIPFPRTVDYRPLQGSVVSADIDLDGRSDLVVSIPSGKILVLRPDGTRLPGWPRTFDNLPQPAFPVGDPGIGDLDGDGSPDIVTCVVSGTPMRRNFLYAMRADGTDLPGWPVEVHDNGTDYFSCSDTRTLLVDLNGDGSLDVVRGLSKGTFVALDRVGLSLPGWPFRLPPDSQGRLREVNADSTAADLDGDGRPELIFVESSLAPRLAAVSYTGRLLPGFPMWFKEIVDHQGPAVADIDGDGTLEVVQPTSPFSGDSIEPAPGPVPGPAIPASLHVVRADGSNASGWPQPLLNGALWGSVLTDLNGDGLPEIVQQDGTDLDVFDAAGRLVAGYPVKVHRDFIRSQSIDISPWVTGDLDGEGTADLLQVQTNHYAGLAYLRVFGLRPSGNPLRGFPFDADGLLAASNPVLTDVTGDGIKDLVILTADGGNGSWILAAWDLGSLTRGRN